jgi:hypothetical protein
VRYGPWDTKGWAYYCTGDHPYYWNNDDVLGFGNNFRFDNKCFTVTENPFAENEPSKMDATITNWCPKHEDITITLGCSKQSTTIPCESTNSGPMKDPACPSCLVRRRITAPADPFPFASRRGRRSATLVLFTARTT